MRSKYSVITIPYFLSINRNRPLQKAEDEKIPRYHLSLLLSSSLFGPYQALTLYRAHPSLPTFISAKPLRKEFRTVPPLPCTDRQFSVRVFKAYYVSSSRCIYVTILPLLPWDVNEYSHKKPTTTNSLYIVFTITLVFFLCVVYNE